VLVGVGATPALAGTYEVPVCDAADGKNNSWTRWSNAGDYPTSQTCPSGGSDFKGLYVTSNSSKSGSRGGGSGWRFTAPEDATVKSIDFELSWRKKDDVDALLATDKGIVRFYGRTGGNFSREGANGVGLNDARYVQTQVSCGASSTCSFSQDFAALGLRGAVVEAEDDTNPELSAKGGSLAASASPVQEGIADVVFNATDNTGIKSARLLVDGDEVDFDPYSYDETRAVPAENRSDGRLVVDTRQLSEGPHTVHLVVVDSAGNEETYEKSIVVDNVADQGGGGGDSDGGGGSRSRSDSLI